MEELNQIFNAFIIDEKVVSYEVLSSGHINRTYLIRTNAKNSYILQKLNSFVFGDIAKLMENKVLLSNHLRKQYLSISEDEKNQKVLTFISRIEDDSYFYEKNGEFFCLSYYIKDSFTYLKSQSPDIAFEAGRSFASFLASTKDIQKEDLHITFPKFHHVGYRYQQFIAAHENARQERISMAGSLIARAKELSEGMFELDNMLERGDLPVRICHNDTKLSNILFDKHNKGLCIIDTDTVMPGLMAYDFGDALRSICNNTLEDEKDLEKVFLNVDLFESFSKGFLSIAKGFMTENEFSSLLTGAKSIIYIMGIRFLSDYLNDDVYFKTKYTRHNLDRAANQFKLLENLLSNYTLLHSKLKTNYNQISN